MSVEWIDKALDELADIYVSEPTPERREWLANHVTETNARLADDGMFLGESRDGRKRVWFHHPLVVGYSLPPGGGVVVFHVRRLKDNSQSDS